MLKNSIILIFLVGVVLTAESSFSQIPVSVSTGPGKSFKQALAERGVGPSKDSLLAALRGSNQNVWSLAAGELAEEHVEQARPLIASDLLLASSGVTKFNLAQALYGLDPVEGTASIVKLCRGSREEAWVTLRLVELLQIENSHDCDDQIIPAANTSEDPSVQLMALSLLSATTSSSVGEARERAFEIELLNNQSSAVRGASAASLKDDKSADAQSARRSRLNIETDPDVRRALTGKIR